MYAFNVLAGLGLMAAAVSAAPLTLSTRQAPGAQNVVASRLSLLRRADVIHVFDEGELLQSGTHNELVRWPGIYRETALLQLMDLEREPEEATA